MAKSSLIYLDHAATSYPKPPAVEAAMRACGVEPIHTPIRGGTDGARLSYEGLPCPNLCTGGENFHSRFEFVSVESMEKIVEILETLMCEAGK